MSAILPREMNAATGRKEQQTQHWPKSMLQICKQSATELRALLSAEGNFANVRTHVPNPALVEALPSSA
jgi:hypothetical protein